MDSTKIRTVRRGDGAYTLAASSGLLTGVAAATNSAGHLFSLRWAPAVQLPAIMVIQRLRAKWVTVSGFTAAQEVGIDLAVLTTYSAAHTGGTAAVKVKKRGTFAASAVADVRIATTGELTDGTHDAITATIGADAYAELAAAATVGKGRMEILKSTEDLDREPLQLTTGQGLVIRNSIGMGAAGTARLIVEMDWLELVRY